MGEPDRLRNRVGSVLPSRVTMDTKSQREEILRHLLLGKTISPLEALEQFGCFRLGARIYDLKKDGYRIKTDIVAKNGKRYASYSLEK